MGITAPCTPEMLRLTAESRITTQGVGCAEDRRWLTERLEFELNEGGFSLSFSLASDISPKGKGKGKIKGKDDKTNLVGKFEE